MDKAINNKGIILSAIKGAIIALCVAMALILIFAFVVKWASLEEGVINPINQIIKIVSIFFGVYGACKNCDKFFYKGLIVGGLFAIISFIIFSMLNNFTFTLSSSLIWDFLFSTLIGGLCSVVVYYIKK